MFLYTRARKSRISYPPDEAETYDQYYVCLNGTFYPPKKVLKMTFPLLFRL